MIDANCEKYVSNEYQNLEYKMYVSIVKIAH